MDAIRLQYYEVYRYTIQLSQSKYIEPISISKYMPTAAQLLVAMQSVNRKFLQSLPQAEFGTLQLDSTQLKGLAAVYEDCPFSLSRIGSTVEMSIDCCNMNTALRRKPIFNYNERFSWHAKGDNAPTVPLKILYLELRHVCLKGR